MKQQHNCEKCIEKSKWHADWSKLFADKSKLYADKSKRYACACQCEKNEEEKL